MGGTLRRLEFLHHRDKLDNTKNFVLFQKDAIHTYVAQSGLIGDDLPNHTTVYNPLAGGLLARAIDPELGPPPGSRFATNKLYTGRYWTPGMHAAAAALRDAAELHGVSSIDLAYGWLRDRPGVDSVLVGPATVAHLDDALAAWSRPLPPELLARADEIHAGMTATDARYAR